MEKTQEKIYFAKTSSSNIDTRAEIQTLLAASADSFIVANTNNNYLAIAGTTFIPANPKFTDTNYNLTVELDDNDEELIKINLVASPTNNIVF